MKDGKQKKRKTTLIIILIGIAVLLAAAISILVIVLINKNTFTKDDGVKVTMDSSVILDCKTQATEDAIDFWKRTQLIVIPFPTSEDWDLNEKLVRNDSYNSNGYPTYTYSWNGKYNDASIEYECFIETHKDSANIIWLKQLTSKIVDNPITLYNSNGERI